MSDGTKIEWTHRPGTIPATMNALVGCQKVSDGCRNCYAIDVAHVRAGNPLQVMQAKFGGTTKREGGKTLWTGKVTLTEKALLAPLHAKKPHTYFVNSMSDLFYDGVPDEWIDRHFAVFALCPQHTFIVLTKRPERMRAHCAGETKRHTVLRLWDMVERGQTSFEAARAAADRCVESWPLPNVWLGVSVENQATADERIPLLLQTPAAIRFLSCEPLLGPVDLTRCVVQEEVYEFGTEKWRRTALERGDIWYTDDGEISDGPEYPRVDWVIAGGESGRGARPMHPDWARGLREECAAADVPFFFKQWGQYAPLDDSERPPKHEWGVIGSEGYRRLRWAGYPEAGDSFIHRVGKKAAGHLLDGVEHHAFPEVRD